MSHSRKLWQLRIWWLLSSEWVANRRRPIRDHICRISHRVNVHRFGNTTNGESFGQGGINDTQNVRSGQQQKGQWPYWHRPKGRQRKAKRRGAKRSFTISPSKFNKYSYLILVAKVVLALWNTDPSGQWLKPLLDRPMGGGGANGIGWGRRSASPLSSFRRRSATFNSSITSSGPLGRTSPAPRAENFTTKVLFNYWRRKSVLVAQTIDASTQTDVIQ